MPPRGLFDTVARIQGHDPFTKIIKTELKDKTLLTNVKNKTDTSKIMQPIFRKIAKRS